MGDRHVSKSVLGGSNDKKKKDYDKLVFRAMIDCIQICLDMSRLLSPKERILICHEGYHDAANSFNFISITFLCQHITTISTSSFLYWDMDYYQEKYSGLATFALRSACKIPSLASLNIVAIFFY